MAICGYIIYHTSNVTHIVLKFLPTCITGGDFLLKIAKIYRGYRLFSYLCNVQINLSGMVAASSEKRVRLLYLQSFRV